MRIGLSLCMMLLVGCAEETTDTDMDGLTDVDEAVYGTDPTTEDSDDDGLSDAQEIEWGTNPTVADSDDDGLKDGEEETQGTDPLDGDTDLDGFLDGDEVQGETDPLDPFSWDYEGGIWCDRSRAAETIYSTGWDIDDVIPNLELEDQHGASFSLHQFAGNVVLIDFSAGWCVPCRDTAANAQELWVAHREQGFMIIHILIQDTASNDPDTAFLEGWANQYNIQFPVARDPTSLGINSFSFTGLYSQLPFLVLLDANMVIDSTYTGSGEEQELDIEIRAIELIAQREE